MRLDVLPNVSASTVDSHGKLQIVSLEKLLPVWKVAVLKVAMPETWRRMRDDWSQRFMDSIQEEIYARVASTTAPDLAVEQSPRKPLELAA